MADEGTMALEVSGLSKGFGEGASRITVLDGVNVALQRGAFEAVMGPSGSGKSTLLHLLAGLITADGGEIRVGGTSIRELSDHDVTCFRRRRIGLIFQDFNLIPTLTAEENIALPLLLDRQKPDAAQIDALLARLGLTHRRSHVPIKLSGGERQRVAIARALVFDPPLVLADEPTGNLDTASSDEVFAELRRMHKERGTSFVIVTHDPRLAARCDRLVELVDGKIARDEPIAGNDAPADAA